MCRRIRPTKLTVILRHPLVARLIDRQLNRATSSTTSWSHDRNLALTASMQLMEDVKSGKARPVSLAEILQTHGPTRADMRTAFGGSDLPIMGPQFRQP